MGMELIKFWPELRLCTEQNCLLIPVKMTHYLAFMDLLRKGKSY